MANKLIYIILINYNNTDDTIECIGSLSEINYDNYRIIIVDNGSKDDERSKLDVIKDKSVNIIYSDNLGFSGGNNIGIKEALKEGADYICLLNNDTVVDPDFLINMVETSEQSEAIGMVSPVLYDYYSPSDVTYYGGYINLFKGNSVICTSAEKYQKGIRKFPPFATGCCMLLKSEVFQKTGLLDETYFLYYEDTDYSIKVSQNYKFALSEKAKVYHKESVSTNKLGSVKLYYLKRNRLYFSKKNIHFPYILFAYFFGTVSIFRNFLHTRDKINFVALIDFLKGKSGKYIN